MKVVTLFSAKGTRGIWKTTLDIKMSVLKMGLRRDIQGRPLDCDHLPVLCGNWVFEFNMTFMQWKVCHSL